MPYGCRLYFFFFFNGPATTEIYTLSLHDALPIWRSPRSGPGSTAARPGPTTAPRPRSRRRRSEEHTSELQSRPHLVCRLLLEKKKNKPSSQDLPPRLCHLLTRLKHLTAN